MKEIPGPLYCPESIYKKYQHWCPYTKLKKGYIYDGTQYIENLYISSSFTGVGKLKNSEGYYYGEFKNGARHGHGRMEYNVNGITGTYIGQFKNNLRWGEGTYFWNENEYYIGSFFKNLMHGQGERFFEDGSHFIGEYFNGKANGWGKLETADGSVFEGEWFDGYIYN